MGHLRLGHLPHTQRWKQVIDLLESGADLPDLAKALQQAGIDFTAQTSSFGFLSAVARTLSDQLGRFTLEVMSEK